MATTTLETAPIALDNTEGAIYVGVLISTALWGAATVQCYFYYNQYRKDALGYKLLVAAVYTLDTAHLCLLAMDPYYRLISHYGQPSFLSSKTSPVMMLEFQYLLIGAFVNLLVQCFYLHCIRILSKGNRVLVASLSAFICAEFGIGLAFYARVLHLPSLSLLPGIIWLPQTASAIDAAAGLFIALSVIYFLNRSRTGFRRTDSMINRIILLTVSTGLMTNIFGVLCFICAIAMPRNNIHMAFFICTTHFYSVSMLASLNARDSGWLQSKRTSQAVTNSSYLTKALEFMDGHNERKSVQTPLEITIHTDISTMSDAMKDEEDGSTIDLVTRGDSRA